MRLFLLFREGHDIKCRSRTYGYATYGGIISNADVMTWMLLTIKLQNVFKCPPWSPISSPVLPMFLIVLLCSLMLSPVFMLSLRRISWYYVFLMFPSYHLLSIACWGGINPLFSCHSCGMDDWFLFLGRLMHHRGCCMSSWFSHHIRIWSLFLMMRMMGTHNKPKGHHQLAHSNFVDVYVCSDRLLIVHAGGRTFL